MELALPQMVRYVSSTLEAQNIEVTAGIESVDRKLKLDMRERYSLFLIIKEAIHNIIKHAEATKVDLQISGKKKKLYISLTDNGVGFTNRDTIGYGIGNMQQRASENRWGLSVTSAHNEGTSVRIEIKTR